MLNVPAEFEELSIFKNVVLPKNYYTIDNLTNFVSTEKVRQICNDLAGVIGGGGVKCGLIKINNGLDYVGFYYLLGNYASITLGTYGQSLRLIGLVNNNPYTYTINGT